MKIIFLVALTYLSFEVKGLDKNDYDIIDAIFGINRTENPTKPHGEQCECVPYYKCENINVNKNGHGIIDIRDVKDCPSYLDVCCDPSDKITTPTPISYKKHFSGNKDYEMQFGEFPWMVAVLAEEINTITSSVLNVYKCGGALIHPQAVLTAAHCVSAREKKYKIRAGDWDTQVTKEPHAHQARFVKSVVIHNEYYAPSLLNDIAILFLEEPVVIGETVNTLSLPDQDIVIPSGTRCFVNSRAKYVLHTKDKDQVMLKRTGLFIVESSTCQEQLRKTRLGNNFVLSKSFVCARGLEEKYTCRGDEGSPLACPIPGEIERYQHIGIVAWGTSCGEDQAPDVYVNVPMFRHWIDEQISNHKLDN